jgi:hypothetical protein
MQFIFLGFSYIFCISLQSDMTEYMEWLSLHHLFDSLQLLHYNDFSSPIPFPVNALYADPADVYSQQHQQQHGSKIDEPYVTSANGNRFYARAFAALPPPSESSVEPPTSSNVDAVVDTSSAASSSSESVGPVTLISGLCVADELLSLTQYVVQTSYYQQLQPVTLAHLHRLVFLIEDCR